MTWEQPHCLLTTKASPRVGAYTETPTCSLDGGFAIGSWQATHMRVQQRKLAVFLHLPFNVRYNSNLLPSSREDWRLAMDAQQCRLYIQSVSLIASDFTLFANGSIGGARVSR